MHFWVSAARVSLPGMAPAHLETSGARWARKIGTNWFMPALVNSRFGESGIRLEEGTIVCPFDWKKLKNDCRISALVIAYSQGVWPVRRKAARWADVDSPSHTRD